MDGFLGGFVTFLGSFIIKKDMITIALIEDEVAVQNDLKLYLKRFADENNYQISVKTFGRADVFVNNYEPIYNLICMDINLPGMNGIDGAKIIRKKDKNTILVFITSLAQYAIKGYEVNAFDFILKPVDYYSLALKLTRIFSSITSSIDKSILISTKSEKRVIKTSDIMYIEVNKHQIIIHTVTGTIYTSGVLKNYYDELKDNGFALCNQCYLVNLGYVKGVKEYSLELTNKELLQISYPRKKEFLRSLNDYFNKHSDTIIK